MFTEKELASHWNPATGKYEGIMLGGWTATTTSEAKSDPKSLDAKPVDPAEVKYVGLQVGQEYTIGVSTVVKPSKELDKNENYHYANRADSGNKLLPVPVKPELQPSKELLQKPQPKIDWLTNNVKQQSIELFSNQPDVAVEAFYDNQSIGQVNLKNDGSGSHGVLELKQPLTTDGTYAIELLTTNTITKDSKVKMLYLTVDTLAPVLYLDAPLTGARTKDGKIKFSGRSSNDAVLKVIGNGKETVLKVQDDGQFSGEVAVESNGPTAELTVKAVDGAGNENMAVVSVTNDRYQVPAGLVIHQVPVMKRGDSRKLETFLRVSDGKDAQGKPKFKEVAVTGPVSYSILSGDAIDLKDDGTMTAQSRGASLVQASYEVSEGVTLQAMAAATVEVPAPTELGTIMATTSALTNDSTRTKVTVTDAGEMLGYQLTYKVFARASVVLPKLNQDISSWSILPAEGIIKAEAGNEVVIAKRTSTGKLAVASTGRMSANVWQSKGTGGTGGGGGGGIPTPAETSEITINQQRMNAEKQDNVLVADITAANVDAAGSGDIVIASSDNTLRGYTFRIDKDVVQQAVGKQRNIIIQVPLAQLKLTPKQLEGMKENLEVHIFPNESYELDALGSIADSLDSSLLGAGQGVSIKTNLPASNWNSYASVQVPVPNSIDPSQVTAVVLKNAEGAWTPLPWKMNAAGNSAIADVQLTGNGNVAFIHNGKTFTDVEDGYWGKDSISQAAAKLFVLGKDKDRFDPESHITRAEYPTILLRVAGMMNKNGQASFNDVNAADWFERSVSVAAQMGIVNGLADGSYAPQATMSRIEAMTMAGRLLKALGLAEDVSKEEADKLLSTFSDSASVPEWARIPAAICIKNGIIEGDNHKVNPLDELTRAQAAAIAIRLASWIASNE